MMDFKPPPKDVVDEASARPRGLCPAAQIANAYLDQSPRGGNDPKGEVARRVRLRLFAACFLQRAFAVPIADLAKLVRPDLNPQLAASQIADVLPELREIGDELHIDVDRLFGRRDPDDE
jgi:hypothetical protein